MNQTTMMHRISQEFPDCECWFTPHYADGFLRFIRTIGLTELAVIGYRHVRVCRDYLRRNGLREDYRGRRGNYDLVVTCSDLVWQKNLRAKKTVLVQEGITDPESWYYRLWRAAPWLIPRWLIGTATAGQSFGYDRFCVASEGYRDLFIRNGVDPGKIRVTGIPNFDNTRRFLDNDLPHRDFVLVCTSDLREKYRRENRRAFIEKSVRIAAGRPLIFKLHPNENRRRAIREIRRWAPGSRVYTTGNAEHMVANCSVLITSYSSTVFVGLALGKECYSEWDIETLRKLLPWQNGDSAQRIAGVVREMLGSGEERERGREGEWKDA